MLIDFFTYTNASPNGRLTPEEIIERAAEIGLDGVVITDREYTVHAEELIALGETHDVFVGIGVELESEEGPLVCVPADVDGFLMAEEWRDLIAFGLPTAQEVIDRMAEIGGVVVARNVYEKGNSLGDAIFRLDGIAALDAIKPGRARIHNEMALEAALALGVPGLAGSSATESTREMGQAATLMFNAVETQAELVESLKSGDCWAVVLGAPADWAPTGGGGGGGPRRDRDEGGRGRSRGRGRSKGGRGGRGRSEGRRGGGRGRGRSRGERGGGGGGRRDRDEGGRGRRDRGRSRQRNERGGGGGGGSQA